MGKCNCLIDEVRFDTRNPELTHVYVFVHGEGDCPIGVDGWHHKVFPARISAIEIYQEHFADFLEWGLEAPPDEARSRSTSKKFVLPKETQRWLDKQPVPQARKNLYTCDTCRGEVVTIDADKGVTPFMIACRATPGCQGTMQSSFYNCDPARVAQFEWYRPETIEGLDSWTQEHARKGGLLLRPLPGVNSDVPHDA